MLDPSSVWIGPRVTIAEDVSVDPFVQYGGRTSIGRGSRIGGFSVLRNMTLGCGAEVVSHAVLSDSVLGDGSKVGPFIVIRDGRSSPKTPRGASSWKSRNPASAGGARFPI